MANKVLKGSISEIQEGLKKYKEDILSKSQLLVERLASEGVKIARVQITSLDAIFTGELLQSIHGEPRERTKDTIAFAIVADSSHAVFVEFGTGSKGADKPYPYPLLDGISWDYNVGKTIRQNPVTGTYYWFYPGKDGKWHYTEGMPSRPFMYNTSMELRKIIEKTAREIFG